MELNLAAAMTGYLLSIKWSEESRQVTGIRETDPLTQSWTYTFDGNNNLVTALDQLN